MWSTDNLPTLSYILMDHGNTKGCWGGIGFVVLHNDVRMTICQETLFYQLARAGEAIVLENTLLIAV